MKLASTVLEDTIFLKSEKRLIRVKIPDIVYVEALGDYSLFHTIQDGPYKILSTMKKVEELLLASGFYRTHNSFIVNINRITKIEENEVFINGSRIPISRERFEPFIGHLTVVG